MSYFYTERGKRYFVVTMFILACWLLGSAATATVRDNARVSVDSGRIAASLLSSTAASEVPSFAVLCVCAHER